MAQSSVMNLELLSKITFCDQRYLACEPCVFYYVCKNICVWKFVYIKPSCGWIYQGYTQYDKNIFNLNIYATRIYHIHTCFFKESFQANFFIGGLNFLSICSCLSNRLTISMKNTRLFIAVIRASVFVGIL